VDLAPKRSQAHKGILKTLLKVKAKGTWVHIAPLLWATHTQDAWPWITQFYL